MVDYQLTQTGSIIDQTLINSRNCYTYVCDPDEVDQGIAGNGNSLKDLIDTIGTSKQATIHLLHHPQDGNTTTYTLDTNEIVSDNITIIPQRGAILDGSGTLTVAHPSQISAGRGQQIYGDTITITFTNPGVGNPGHYYGCDLTGVTDSAAAVNACVTSLPSGVLDLKGLTLRIDSTIDLKSNVTVEGYGGSIDFSNAAAGDYLFDASGSAATAQDVLEDVAQGDEVIKVTDAGNYWSASDWTYIADDDTWSVNGTKMGEWVHVLSISGTTVNLGSDLLYAYTTGDNAKLSVITFIENLYIKGVKATGASDSDWFLFVSYGKNINIEDCHISDFDHAGIGLYYTIQFNVSNNKIFRSDRAGLGYGVVVVASANGSIEDNYFEKCRHGVAIGGKVIPNRYVITKNNYTQSPTDAGLDGHPSTEFCIWDGNTVQGGEESGISADGIIVQGANNTIINNIIVGVERHGIFVQNYIDNDSIPSSYLISKNQIYRVGDGTYGDGIFVEIAATSTGPIKGLTITDNIIKKPSRHGIYVYARTADIDSVIITGNNISGVASSGHRNIWLYALTGFTMTSGVISNNVSVRDDDLSYNLYLQAADATGITYFSIMGNSLENGSGGIIGLNTDFLSIIGNPLLGMNPITISVTAGTNEIHHNPGA